MNKFIILIVLLIKFIFLNNFSIADYDEALRFYNSMDWKQSKEKCEEVNIHTFDFGTTEIARSKILRFICKVLGT